MMRKKIRIKIEPGGNLGEEVYCIDMYNEKDMKTEAITKKTEISFTGKKVDCLLDSTIRLKIRNPRVKKPYVVFIEGDTKKKIKMSVKKNAHYKDRLGIHHLVIRRDDTKDTKEFLWLVSDDRYISNLITH
jgi:hypothetical protein